jgi:hypothetical protein
MGYLEIIAIIIFPLSYSSFELAVQQSRVPMPYRIGMFRSELFISIVFFPSLAFMIASAVILGLYSWVLLVALFIGTPLVFPLFGRYLLVMLWSFPYELLDRWARKRLDD